MTVLLYLGDIKLDALGVRDLPGSRSWSYAEQKTIEGLPVLQLTGRDSDTYSLNVRIHPALGVPLSIIKQLETAGDNGEVLVLQTGMGEQLGSYVLTAIEKNRILTTPRGDILIAELGLKLKEHRFVDIEFDVGIAIEGNATATDMVPVPVDDSRDPDEVTLGEIVRSG